MPLNLKIVIPIPVLLKGGTEIQTINLIKVLVSDGCYVIVLCYYDFDDEIVNRIKNAGAKVVLLMLQRKSNYLHLTIRLIRKFRTLAPDIIHVQYVAPGFVPIIAARLAGMKKIIATVHQPGRAQGFKARLLLRLAAKLCNLFLCVSRSTEESWFGNSAVYHSALYKRGRRHFTIYNAVDTESIINQAASNQVHKIKKSLNLKGKKIVGYVGRLREEKGVDILIAAFAEVLSKIPETMLIVVGDGPDREKLKAQSVELGISLNIIRLGHKTQEEVYQLYGLMDVMAAPSFFEGFGLAAAEAIAAGVPVVASNIDGLKEVIDIVKAGKLVKVGDTYELSENLIKILSNRSTSNHYRTPNNHLRNIFSIDSFMTNILSAYRSVQETYQDAKL